MTSRTSGPSRSAKHAAPFLSSPSEARRAGRLGEIVYRDPATLTPYANNSRKHSERQLKQLRAAIDEFGFTQPILLRDEMARDELRIGAGHGRQLAAMLEPKLDRVPTIIVSGLTDKQWRGLIIADNKIALNAEWDHDMLAAEIVAIGGDEFDVAVLGFSDGELADLSEIPEPSSSTGTGKGTVTCPKCQHCFVPE